MLQSFMRLKTVFELSKDALKLASKELSCLPKTLKSYRYGVGFQCLDGGADFSQVFESPNGSAVEMSYSHVVPNKGWTAIKLTEKENVSSK